MVSSSCLFCKQKTAYEMRISDWSSDVGSSDLETVYDCLVAAARIDPAKTAIVALAPGGSGDVDAILTYGDYLRQSTAAANLFHHLAGERRSVVAPMLPIVPAALVAAWGSHAAGVANRSTSWRARR